jgi:hypothetical protein
VWRAGITARPAGFSLGGPLFLNCGRMARFAYLPAARQAPAPASGPTSLVGRVLDDTGGLCEPAAVCRLGSVAASACFWWCSQAASANKLRS